MCTFPCWSVVQLRLAVYRASRTPQVSVRSGSRRHTQEALACEGTMVGAGRAHKVQVQRGSYGGSPALRPVPNDHRTCQKQLRGLAARVYVEKHELSPPDRPKPIVFSRVAQRAARHGCRTIVKLSSSYALLRPRGIATEKAGCRSRLSRLRPASKCFVAANVQRLLCG